MLNLGNSKEFTRFGNEHADYLATAIDMYGVDRDMTVLEACKGLRLSVEEDMINEIFKGNNIYINKAGGWFRDKDLEYKQWYIKEGLDFPKFSKDKLRITRFPFGKHWYVHLGDMEVRDRDKLKWDSYEEAYEYTKQFIDNDE